MYVRDVLVRVHMHMPGLDSPVERTLPVRFPLQQEVGYLVAAWGHHMEQVALLGCQGVAGLRVALNRHPKHSSLPGCQSYALQGDRQ